MKNFKELLANQTSRNSDFFETHVHQGTLTFQKNRNHKNFLENFDLRHALKALFLNLFLIISLMSCTKITPKSYQNNTPNLDIRKYLSGNIKAWGTLEDRSGKITRRFTVDMVGTWKGNEGILQEHFQFDDATKDSRTWKINFTDQNNFIATAGDVVGIAKGEQYGNAMRMSYVLDLKLDSGKNYHVSLDDWMYLIDEKTLINKSTIKKFGITFGKLTIFFRKSDE
jgi:hypothetical protein